MTSFDRDFDDLTFDAELFDYLVHTVPLGVLTAIANGLALSASEALDVIEEMRKMEATGNVLSLNVGQPVNQIMAQALASAIGLPLSIIERAANRSACIMQARGEISYGGFVLNQAPYYVDLLGVYSAASREVTRTKLLRGGSTRIAASYNEKIIALEGSIVAQHRSKQAMENLLDKLHRYLSLPLQDLKVGFEDQRFYSPVELDGELSVDWSEESKNLIKYQARFISYDPFAFANSIDSEVDTNPLSQVSGDHRAKSVIVSPGGSIYTYPVITIQFPASVPSPYGTTVLWVTNNSVNPNQTVEITKAFLAGDIIEIDSYAQTVKVNTLLADFEGKFPYIDPRVGPNTLEINSTSTSNPSLTVSVSWRNRFHA